MVMVNLPTAGVDYHVPFGGRKGSSYGAARTGPLRRGVLYDGEDGVHAAVTGKGGDLFLTSPRLRGEVGAHRKCDPGEGVQVCQLAPAFAVRAPHPDPLPASAGRGRTHTSAFSANPTAHSANA